MKVLLILVFLAIGAYGRNHGHDKYEGHLLYEIQGPSYQISKLDGPLDLLSVRPVSSDWSGMMAGHLKALVALSPSERGKWVKIFEVTGIASKLVHDNLAQMFRAEEEAIRSGKIKAHREGRNMSWDTYYRHDEINDYLDEMAAAHPNLVTVINAGLSTFHRQIKYVRVSTTRFEDLSKPVIFIDAAIHAREWVTPPVALYILEQLVADPGGDLTDKIDWIILPMANPDGYEYTHTVDRMWRKTLSMNHPGAEDCPGVDGNRNFAFGWGTDPSTANPCSLVYEGPAPFSEPETRIIRDAVLTHMPRIQMYIALHSYGNMFLYSYGTNASLPHNGLHLHLAGMRMAAAIDEIALQKADKYIVGNAAVVLYYSTGTSRDWTRSVGIPLTYTLELPGYEYDFIVPPSYIRQIVTETWIGIQTQAQIFINSSTSLLTIHPSIRPPIPSIIFGNFSSMVTAKALPPSITTANVAPPSIPTANVAPPSITTANVAPPYITTANLAPSSIISTDVAPPPLTTVYVAPSPVVSTNIAPPSVTTANEPSPSIKTVDVAPPLINSPNVAPPSIIMNVNAAPRSVKTANEDTPSIMTAPPAALPFILTANVDPQADYQYR